MTVFMGLRLMTFNGCLSSFPGYFYQHMLAYGKYTMSTLDTTRKMVNYAWSGWSQGKPWWRTEAVL